MLNQANHIISHVCLANSATMTRPTLLRSLDGITTVRFAEIRPFNRTEFDQ
jgi:hypothetical protein